MKQSASMEDVEFQGLVCKLVRQRQWDTAHAGSDRSRLYSQNYSLCSAFAGIDPENGWAFLCHFDTFCSVNAIDDLAEELERLGADFNKFELHTASSYWWPRTFLVSALVSWFIPGPFFWFVLLSAMALSSTRLHLLWKIWRLRGSKSLPKHHGSFLQRRFQIMVDADTQEIVAQRYSGKGVVGDFSAPKCWLCKAQKAGIELGH